MGLQLRVLWPGDPELQKVDGGFFEKWLRETEEARENGDLKAVGSCQAQASLERASAFDRSLFARLYKPKLHFGVGRWS